MTQYDKNSRKYQDAKHEKLFKDIDENVQTIKALFRNSFDVLFQEINIVNENKLKAVIIFINGLTSKSSIESNVVKPLLAHINTTSKEALIDLLDKNELMLTDFTPCDYLDQTIEAILVGRTIILIDGCDYAFEMDTSHWKERDVTEPNAESVVRGPREGFTENMITNTALIRRKIKTPRLTFESLKIGKLTQTQVIIASIEGVTNNNLIKEMKIRLSRIDTDSVLDAGYIEQFIEDEPFSLFPTVGFSEKPDVIASKLLEGRIALIVDGSPDVLSVPHLFIETIQSSEDYYTRPWYASFIRLLRLLSLIIVLYFPSVYIAAQTYHQEMLPTQLFITMAASKEGVPFPAVIELLIMSVLFEILKEAGVRMPKPIGLAVNIVGALVLGEAAVEAGLVSSPIVMITALAGIAGFTIYPLNDSITFLRFAFIILGAVSGLFGITIGSIFVLIHLVSIRSFGAPYMSPLAPRNKNGLIDSIIRGPLWMMNHRPRAIGWKNNRKQRIHKLKYKK